MNILLYGGPIREAIASNDLEKMKALAAQAKETIKAHGDLAAAYIDLVDAINSLEGKGKGGKKGKGKK